MKDWLIYDEYYDVWYHSVNSYTLPFEVTRIGLFYKEWENWWWEHSHCGIFNDFDWGYL